MDLERTPSTSAGRPAGLRNHPAERDLTLFMCGELPPAEARVVVRHLLASCPQCLEVTRRFWRPPQPAVEVVEVPGEETRPIRLAVSLAGRLLEFHGR
jgi:hypothetical protein